MSTSGSEEQIELPRPWTIRDARLALILIGVSLVLLVAYVLVTDVSHFDIISYTPLELRGFLAAKQALILAIQLPLFFLGTLIITKLSGVGFGPRGLAVLKLAALAIAILAIHRATDLFFDQFFFRVGFVGSVISRFATLAVFWVLAVTLFELDKVGTVIALVIAAFLPFIAAIFFTRLLFDVLS